MYAVTSVQPSSNPSLLSGQKLFKGLSLLLIAGLCVANALLIKQNRDLKAAMSHMVVVKEPELLKPGEQVPPFVANTLSGQQQAVNYANYDKTVFLVFSPQCPACEQSIPYWKEIKAACDRNRYQVFGVSLTNDGLATSAFLASSGLGMEAFVDIDAQTKTAYKLSLTPLVIVIDSSGKVDRVWSGAFTGEMKLNAARYFAVSVGTDVK